MKLKTNECLVQHFSVNSEFQVFVYIFIVLTQMECTSLVLLGDESRHHHEVYFGV